jgi:hypothetical protein
MSPDIQSSDRVNDWEKTSLKEYIRYFKLHVDRIMADARLMRRKEEEEVDQSGMAVTADMIEF